MDWMSWIMLARGLLRHLHAPSSPELRRRLLQPDHLTASVFTGTANRLMAAFSTGESRNLLHKKRRTGFWEAR